jgi:threonine aldolase
MGKVVDEFESDTHESFKGNVLNDDVMADADPSGADAYGEDNLCVGLLGGAAYRQLRDIVRGEAELFSPSVQVSPSLLTAESLTDLPSSP